MPAVKVSAKGWIVIPADIRKRYGIKPGDEVHIVDYAGTLVIVPKLKDPVNDALGLLAGGGPLLTEGLLKERRRELQREETKIERWSRDGG
jgi:AbrB family looped-hinge helix DNA binding protein